MNLSDNTKVGIIIPTKNRSDFVIRALKYYLSLNSPHPLYIGDSSDSEEAGKIIQAVDQLKSKLPVVYLPFPDGDTIKKMIYLLSNVKEKYATYTGDDDYHVPKTLTECARFLEDHGDYESAIGRSITFKLTGNGAYGSLKETHDYPRRSIESDSASERLYLSLGPALTPLINSVMKTKKFRQFFQNSESVFDVVMRSEILPNCRLVVAGKHKVIDRLGFVRQIHDRHFKVPDMYDQLMSPEWYKSYHEIEKIVVADLKSKEAIGQEEAEYNFKKAFWNYLNMYLPRFYRNFTPSFDSPSKKIGFRTRLAASLPVIKKVYRKIRPLFNKKIQLHYEVLQTGSKYYEDFKPIRDSFNPHVHK